MTAEDAVAAKAALRARLLARRAARMGATSDEARTATGLAIAATAAEFLARLPVPAPRVIAAYLSLDSEPPTDALLQLLAAGGHRLIVPVLVEGGDLDWTPYAPGDPIGSGRRRTLQPVAAANGGLGLDAVATADLVVVPALAVDRSGRRLGRGGGSYDRALGRVRSGVPVLAVIYDDEVLDEVPTQPHDRAVDGALTPGGLALFGTDPPS